MANNYKGYLIKFGDTIMPNQYFFEYSSTPDQRLENDAARDNSGNLHRTTLPNGKTSISFSTRILNLNEKINFQNIIKSSIENSVERKCYVTYWNDETNNYDTAYFYIPDVKYSIKDADSTDIQYNPISVELAEY